MKFSWIIFAALVAAVAFADNELDLEFVAGANLTDASTNFKFRWQFSKVSDVIPPITIPIQLPSKAFFWSSGSVDAKTADSSALASGDAILSAAFPPSSVFFPFAVLASGKGQAALQFKIDNFVSSWASLSGSFNAGLMSMVALSMDEFDADGKYVDGSHVSFRSDSDVEEIKSGDISGMTCTENINNAGKTNPVKAKITYLTTQKAGILKYGDTPVSPRSIDMIIQVENFKLSDKKNHIRLNLGIVDAAGSGKISGNAEIVKKNGIETYVAVNTHAVVDDKTTEVEVSVKNGNLGEDSLSLAAFNAVMQLTMSGQADTRVVTVDFPAGVQSFVYDPAAGTGFNVYKSGASTAAISLFVLLVCSLLFLF